MVTSAAFMAQKSDTILVLSDARSPSSATWATDIQLRGFNQVRHQSLSLWLKSPKIEDVPHLFVIDLGEQMSLPDALIPWVRKAPMIVVMNHFDEDQFIQLYDLGVQDVLIHPVNSTYLSTRLLSALDKSALCQKLEKRERLLAASGVYDPDVRLFNAPYWEQLVYEEVRKLPTQHFVDAVNFSLISVQLISGVTGQPVRLSESGCYKALADELLSVCRGTDIAGRFGEDLMGVLLPATQQHQAELLCQRLEASLKKVLPLSSNLRLVFRAVEVNSSTYKIPEILSALS